MTPLILSLALTAPAQPPVPQPYRPAPGVIVHPQASSWGRPVSLPPPIAPYTAFPVTPPLVQHNPVAQPYPLPQPQPAVPAVTLDEFSRVFTPLPGKHEVWFVHPYTCRPVLVCFTLPQGKLRDFEVDKYEIRFEIGKCDVEITFRKNGTVKVEYND